MGSNGMSILAFYKVEIFKKVRKNHPKVELILIIFPIFSSRPALRCPPRTPPGSPPSLRSSAPSLPSIFSIALKGKAERFICDVDVTSLGDVCLSVLACWSSWPSPPCRCSAWWWTRAGWTRPSPGRSTSCPWCSSFWSMLGSVSASWLFLSLLLQRLFLSNWGQRPLESLWLWRCCPLSSSVN